MVQQREHLLPNSDSKIPKTEFHWLSLGHMPIHEPIPITRGSGRISGHSHVELRTTWIHSGRERLQRKSEIQFQEIDSRQILVKATDVH